MIREHAYLFGKNMFAQTAEKDKECSAQNKSLPIQHFQSNYQFVFNHNR